MKDIFNDLPNWRFINNLRMFVVKNDFHFYIDDNEICFILDEDDPYPFFWLELNDDGKPTYFYYRESYSDSSEIEYEINSGKKWKEIEYYLKTTLDSYNDKLLFIKLAHNVGMDIEDLERIFKSYVKDIVKEVIDEDDDEILFDDSDDDGSNDNEVDNSITEVLKNKQVKNIPSKNRYGFITENDLRGKLQCTCGHTYLSTLEECPSCKKTAIELLREG